MKKADLDQIAVVIENKLNEALAPLLKTTDSHQQTLHGVNGEDGLVREVAGIRRKVFLITSGIAGVVTAGLNILTHMVWGKQ